MEANRSKSTIYGFQFIFFFIAMQFFCFYENKSFVYKRLKFLSKYLCRKKKKMKWRTIFIHIHIYACFLCPMHSHSMSDSFFFCFFVCQITFIWYWNFHILNCMIIFFTEFIMVIFITGILFIWNTFLPEQKMNHRIQIDKSTYSTIINIIGW